MATRAYSNEFLTYVALLRQLRQLISEGRGESPEADRLRDEMDEPWTRLTPEDIAEIDELAARGDELFPLASEGDQEARPGGPTRLV